MKHISLATLTILSIIIFSCGKIKGNGNMIETTRSVADFKGIEIDIPSNVVVYRNDSYEFKMKVESNIEPYIITQVKDSILKISFKSNANITTLEPIQIQINSPLFSFVKVTGSSDIHVDSLHGEKCAASITGTGDITIEHIFTPNLKYDCTGSGNMEIQSGEVLLKDLDIRGSGNVRMENALTNVASIHISGSGDVYTNTTDSMYIRISGSGNVYYKGNPKINISAVGSGTAKAL